jgi:hypothetical protein
MTDRTCACAPQFYKENSETWSETALDMYLWLITKFQNLTLKNFHKQNVKYLETHCFLLMSKNEPAIVSEK